MKVIVLTQGKTTIVDDADYERFGQLKWHCSHGRAVRRPGAWARQHTGTRGVVWLHREIMGNPQGIFVDHINGNPLDNRRANLRLCTKRENTANQAKRRKPTTSKFKGVYKVSSPAAKNIWQAYIGSARSGERQHLGSFATEQEAAIAYNVAAVKKYGDFARLNIVE